ncbi:unnamed protein product [Vitrella brassicaformis CCMP3155]|uniref:Uncharacterized protein n=1 Tax=Vitrella brassicaformis (strain CCMP3155) TaxID=1169540 RepID=A0A0G4ESE3_VITBC|nr:unnamed protein product [Vitrella brassicaformis CCMP3155]|eukprot:CEM00790.1 unnamed protein product [Vitrella brassicaformis CCMP3155]
MQASGSAPVQATQADKERLYERIDNLKGTSKLSASFLQETKTVIMNLESAAVVTRVGALVDGLYEHAQRIPCSYADTPVSLAETIEAVKVFWKDLWKEGQRDLAYPRSGQ